MKYEKINPPKRKTSIIVILSQSALGWKSPKPIVANVVKL